MPFFVYEKGEQSKLSSDLILNNFTDNTHVINYEEFIHSINDESLIYGIEVKYIDGSGKARHELWNYKDNLVFIKYSNIGYRNLSYHSKDKLSEIMEIINEEKEDMMILT